MKRLFGVTLLLVSFLCLPVAAQADAIRFGVPPWPGVTVKSEVVCQILEAMGYDTVQLEIGPPIIYKGLTTDDVDVCVAAWIPQQNEMFLPLRDKKAIDVVAVNIDEAGTSLCVPSYVWEAGVRSIADLDARGEMFDRTIYGIEVGSGMQTSTEKMIHDDVAGLGDWTQVSSTTPVMLRAVQERIRAGKWVVFHGWQPHWMNFQIDMKYLEGVPGTEKLVSESVVYTIASRQFATRHPQAHAFLKKFYVRGATQSQWINDFGFRKTAPEKVASDWIRANIDTVATWLDGVTAADGSAGIDAVRAAFNR
ncbi:ABC transporter substrate-binding protein [Oleidesulfovibrio alaskensis]|uniref:ABC transporter substrate-binding protein n=1 Tax=Oleidesulfovibrio alaskensis TaxID=58180 RepID=UPI001A37413C|nr:ABC transporter substrate-binding protein [Oleidesulfovibrio alaskensis]MBL3583643.1 ABC transporter substrate-binding protein [Oleidesulfovibrio alaskensis]